MIKVKIFIDYDHNAVSLAMQLIQMLQNDYEIICLDGRGKDPYPLIAHQMAKTVAGCSDARGILLCGTGIGMSIVANKIQGVYAHCCRTAEECEAFRQYNNGNVLCLGAKMTSLQQAKVIVDIFLSKDFCEENRKRISLIEQLFGE